MAVVKKDSSFLLNQVKGVKSCHSAFNSSVGWDIPVGTLRPLLNWAGPSEPLQKGDMAGGLRMISGRALYSSSYLASHLGTTQSHAG